MQAIDFDRLRDRAYEAFPGVSLESVIQACVYLKEFDKGISVFDSLKDPSVADFRWQGVCFFQLFEDHAAQKAFEKSIDGGHLAARINLAHLLTFSDTQAAETELSKVNRSDLRDYDLVFFHRIRSFIFEAEGNLKSALSEAETAWKHVQGLPEFRLLAPGIFTQLGVLYGRTGREQRALLFLDNAAQITEDSDLEKVRLKRAFVLNTLGRVREALVELSSFTPDQSNLGVEMLRLKGEIAWGTGELAEAIGFFDKAGEQARAIPSTPPYEHFLCHLSLATLLGHRGESATAQKHLKLAQGFITDRTDRMAFRFREVLLQRLSGAYSNRHAREELLILAKEFKAMGLMKEEGAIYLHSASLGKAAGESIEAEFSLLQTLTRTLQNKSFLAKEWWLVNNLTGEIDESVHEFGVTEPPTLELITIDNPQIIFDGSEVQIPLSRSFEILAYFLEHRTAGLEDILADLFPEEDKRSARNYFHQFRHQLKTHIPEVSIDYEEISKKYHLRSVAQIVWDVAEERSQTRVVEGGLADYAARFLPGVNSPWVRFFRRKLTSI